MTTIVWKPGYLAADRRITGNMIYVGSKLSINVVKGYALAIGGDLGTALALKNWYLKGGDPELFPEAPTSEEDYAELIVAHQNGTVQTYSSSAYPETFEMPFLAWGTGGSAAMGALRMGASIQEAISIAAVCDPGTGEGIDTADLTGNRVIIYQSPLLSMNEDGTVRKS